MNRPIPGANQAGDLSGYGPKNEPENGPEKGPENEHRDLTAPRGWRQLVALLQADARSIRRDSLLRWTLILCLGVFLPMMRWLPPMLNNGALARHGFDLTPWFGLIQSSCLLIAPVLVGIVGGLLILDQRDEGVMTGIAVTPLGVEGYLMYRIAVPGAVAFLITILMLSLVGLAPLSAGGIFFSSLCAAPLAPLLASTIALLASNKIQGFAIAKGNGLITAPVIAAWFVSTPKQWLFMALPTFAPVKICWLAMQQQAWLWLVPVSLTLHGLLLYWLHRRLRLRCQ